MNASDSTTTSCCVCCKEIPLDAAFTRKARNIEHFCGWSVINASKRVPRQGTKPMPIRTPATRYRQIEACPNLTSGQPTQKRRIDSIA